jgi:hypothetical protein
MAYEIKGLVRSVSEVKQITEKFAKRELVLEHGDKYPQVTVLEASGERMSLLDSVRAGDTVTVQFDLRGREGRDGRIWNTLAIWKVGVDSKGVERPSGGAGSAQDDIPFRAIR